MSRFDLEGVVFDVDGVLFDTERLSQETWNAVSTELNWPQVGRAYLEFVGQKIDEGTFEVKRIYIAPAFRRKGVASAVIAALEQDAAKHGFTKAILETARTTEDSAALYTKLGYRVIPYYGSPAGAENCLCFEKNLGD